MKTYNEYKTGVIEGMFLSIFEWSLKTGFAVTANHILAASSCTHVRICVHVGTPLMLFFILVHELRYIRKTSLYSVAK